MGIESTFLNLTSKVASNPLQENLEKLRERGYSDLALSIFEDMYTQNDDKSEELSDDSVPEIDDETLAAYEEAIAKETSKLDDEAEEDEKVSDKKDAQGTEKTSTSKEDDSAVAEAKTKAAEASKAASAAKATSAASSTTAVTNDEIEELQKEIDEKQAEKDSNNEKMDKLEAQIEKCADEAREQVKNAKEIQEKGIKEHEEDVDKAVKEEMGKYIEANKNGEGMTRDELQKNIQDAIPGAPDLAQAVASLTAASELVDEMDDYLGELKTLIDANAALDQEIDSLTDCKDKAEKAAAEAAEKKKSCCDPIGFTTEDGAKYDFIVDDGDFDSVNDFLGADDQWAAMQALDTDGNGTVDANELSAGNIKAVKTDADGNQQVVDLAEEFGDEISIDLSTFDKNGTNANIDTSDADGDGVANQALQGTFKVNIGDKQCEGYDTLDDTDWLAEQYGVSAGTEDVEDSEGLDKDRLGLAADTQAHQDFYDMYTQISEELKEEIKEGYNAVGFNDFEIADIDEAAGKQAARNAKVFKEENGISSDENVDEKVANTIVAEDDVNEVSDVEDIEIGENDLDEVINEEDANTIVTDEPEVAENADDVQINEDDNDNDGEAALQIAFANQSLETEQEKEELEKEDIFEFAA